MNNTNPNLKASTWYGDWLKPILDRLVALFALIVISPVFLMIVILLFVFQDGHVWFTQMRPGKNERLFRLIKFKTMNERRNSRGELLSDVERLTKIGKFIRKTSLDELPQLINVIKGEMSFVGPRPLLVEYLPLYNEQQKKRHGVTPGITGWAQVNGRNAIDWQTKFKLDVWYVDNQSFWVDIKIMFRTLLKVVKSEGINSSTAATMERFTGNDQ
ncbi:MAG: sugar transferase [Bacteroidetes bacterium]|nr:sugar transferase [Bacteroidota bacterium]